LNKKSSSISVDSSAQECNNQDADVLD